MPPNSSEERTDTHTHTHTAEWLACRSETISYEPVCTFYIVSGSKHISSKINLLLF